MQWKMQRELLLNIFFFPRHWKLGEESAWSQYWSLWSQAAGVQWWLPCPGDHLLQGVTCHGLWQRGLGADDICCTSGSTLGLPLLPQRPDRRNEMRSLGQSSRGTTCARLRITQPSRVSTNSFPNRFVIYVKLHEELHGTVCEDKQNPKALLAFCQYCWPPPGLHPSAVTDPLNHHLHGFYTS